MSKVKLRQNVTGEIIERTELNWKHLPNDRKAQYTVVDGDVEVSKPAKNFTPPELKKVAAPKKVTEPTKSTEPKSESAPDDETQEQMIVRLYNAAAPKGDDEKKEVIKSIAKQVAAHYKTVEKVVNAIK